MVLGRFQALFVVGVSFRSHRKTELSLARRKTVDEHR